MLDADCKLKGSYAGPPACHAHAENGSQDCRRGLHTSASTSKKQPPPLPPPNPKEILFQDGGWVCLTQFPVRLPSSICDFPSLFKTYDWHDDI